MRSLLLSPKVYEEILSLFSLEEALAYLLNTSYGRFIEGVGKAPSEIAKVEEGLRRNLSDTFKKIYDIASGRPKSLITLLLGHWDVYNIKTIIRAKKNNLTLEEFLPFLIPTGELSEPLIQELARQPDIKGIANILATWGNPYATPLISALREYKATEDLSILDLELDRYYFSEALKQLRGRDPNLSLVERVIRYQIDRANILTCLRIIKEGRLPDIERYFIEGGFSFSKGLFKEVAAENQLDQAIDILKKYIPVLKRIKNLDRVKLDLPSLIYLERAIEGLLLWDAIRSLRSDPLGIGVVIGYIWQKINEITNLRLILRGKLVGMHVEETMELLVL